MLSAAVALADEGGADALSMRKIAQHLGVVPMALYKHVAHKDELLDGMIDAVVGEIDPLVEDADWKTTVRLRVLSARRMLLRHSWAPGVIEARMKARAAPTPAVTAYLDQMIGVFRAGGSRSTSSTTRCTSWAAGCWGSRRSCSTTAPAAPGRGRAAARGGGRALPAHRRAGPGGDARQGVGRRLGL